MSLRQGKIFRQLCCSCKLKKHHPCEASSSLELNQRRFFNIHEKASGRVDIGILGAPIQSGQVHIAFVC